MILFFHRAIYVFNIQFFVYRWLFIKNMSDSVNMLNKVFVFYFRK